MDIINKTVWHKTFGEGTIREIRDSVIIVGFASAVRKFIFPDAFREYLFLPEKQSRQFVEEILAEIDNDIKSRSEKENRESENKKFLRSLPLHANSQAAFGFYYNDRQKAAKDGNVSVGNYQSGINRGKPRIPSRIFPNSACLLTHRKDNDPEEDRYIWGVFMVREDFIGTECTNGIIPAHDKYRILLAEGETEQFRFWKYFDLERKSKSAKWGSVEFKYFSNMTMAHILHDILATKRSTNQQPLCKEFMNYFCQLNKIDYKLLLSQTKEM